MSAYDAKVDVAALFAVGRDIEPETLQHIFQRINDEAQAMGAAEAQANALAALHTRRRIAEDFSQMCNVREVITGCIRAVEKLGDDGGTSDLDAARAEITRLSGEVARLEAVIADGGFSAWEVACSRADRLFLEGERLRGALERIATSGCEGDGEHAECGDVCIGHEPCDCLSHRAARALRGEPLATDWGRASCAHLCVDCAGFNKCGRCDGARHVTAGRPDQWSRGAATMKPVDQTTFGHPGGNCFSACVASLLALTIEDVPYFMDETKGKWHDQLDEWLAPRGFYAIHFTIPDRAVYDEQDLWPKGFYILNGRSPRGDHAVIARGAKVEHDPHPSRAALESIDGCVLLVPTFDDPPTSGAGASQRVPRVGDVWMVTDDAKGGRTDFIGRQVTIRSADTPLVIYDYVNSHIWGELKHEDFRGQFAFVRPASGALGPVKGTQGPTKESK